MRRVLVTGASGFVGQQTLAPLAALGFEVHATARRAGAGTAIWHEADMLDPNAQRALLARVRPTHLLHCAWYVAHGRFWTAPENGDWLAASLALLRAFQGERFVGIGSCAEYAASAPGDGAPWPETRPLAPATPYGQAKAALAAALPPGSAWARLFHLFGPGEDPARLVPSVLLALREGREAPCGSGRPVRDFASTWFVGRALAALTASTLTGAVNVASGEGVAIRDVVARLGALAGRPELIRLGARPDPVGETAYMVADTTRLRSVFPEPAALDAELQRAAAPLVTTSCTRGASLRSSSSQ